MADIELDKAKLELEKQKATVEVQKDVMLEQARIKSQETIEGADMALKLKCNKKI